MKLINFIGIVLGIFGIYIAFVFGSMDFCEKTLSSGGKNSMVNISTPMTWIGFTCVFLISLCGYNLNQLYKNDKSKIK